MLWVTDALRRRIRHEMDAKGLSYSAAFNAQIMHSAKRPSAWY